MELVSINVEIKNIAFLKNNMYNVIGNFDIQNKTLTYNEDESTNVSVSYSDMYITLRRKNKALEMELNFKENKFEKGHYYINELDSYILIKTYTKFLKIEKNKIIIEYQIIIDNDIIEQQIIIKWESV